MKFLYNVALCLLAAVSASKGNKDSDVHQLTGAQFDEFVADNQVVMAEFYAPWCGHCQALEPEYEIAAAKLKESGIPIAKIDCTQEEELCAEQMIQGYPTIKVFHGSSEGASIYPGARKADAIISYMVRQSLPAVTNIDSADALSAFVKSDPLAVVGFFDAAKDNSTFGEVAQGLRDKFVFGASNDKALADKYGVSQFPALAVFKEGSAEPVIYEGKDLDFEATKLARLVNVESFPEIGEVGPGTFQDYATAKIPLLYIFVGDKDERKSLTDMITPLAKKLKGHANIGFLDAAQYGGHAQNVNLEQKWPAIVVQDFESNHKFVFPQDQEITKTSLTKFVDDFIAGSLEPNVKSEEVPETQDEGVVKVVGKSFSDIVMDDDKDVLIEIYAPWCGHCKKLAPTYEELGQVVKNDSKLKDKVVVAKLDHTLNEIPIEVRGYPTILLFPAGNKDAPIDFNGQRSFEGLSEFIKDKGTHKAEISKPAEKADEAEKVEKTEKAEKVEKADKKADKAEKKPKEDL